MVGDLGDDRLASVGPGIVVYSDLDGSLLERHDYSFEAALPALQRLREERIPLVFVTSKTRAEVMALQESLRLHEPFATENGGGLFFPSGGNVTVPGATVEGDLAIRRLGAPYAEIRHLFECLRAEFPIEGFGDWSIEAVADRTGLEVTRAALAKQREFSEPFLLADRSLTRALSQEVARQGFAVLEGGRFLHLVGRDHDKGRAIRMMTEGFAGESKGKILTVAVGDQKNDLEMLQAAEFAIVLPKADGTFIDIEHSNLHRVSLPASAGWNEGVLAVLRSVTGR